MSRRQEKPGKRFVRETLDRHEPFLQSLVDDGMKTACPPYKAELTIQLQKALEQDEQWRERASWLLAEDVVEDFSTRHHKSIDSRQLPLFATHEELDEALNTGVFETGDGRLIRERAVTIEDIEQEDARELENMENVVVKYNVEHQYRAEVIALMRTGLSRGDALRLMLDRAKGSTP
ncbi:hypothetical protein PQR34_45365 [Paraburkholderia sediminicola]|uniref:hypothetical protein n=1 Tax=Paraburkholderia sediminicola TaxID=458836 RepID=UPI0038B995C5